ncbi:MAG: hypothetical protein PHF23_00320 [Smithellaceae bacterium]|nr:hypothetical protein [Smithellaceae bacterium]
MKTNCTLVIGGYVNGYSIIRELHEQGVQNIVLFDYQSSLASKSNRIKIFKKIGKTTTSLKEALFEINKKFDYCVLFPTDDLQLEQLHTIYNEISSFCFVPFNYNNLLQSLNKFVQYRHCKEHGIPYPKTLYIEKDSDLKKIDSILYPILIKPSKRNDLCTNVFRSLILDSVKDLHDNTELLIHFLRSGQKFLASEIIPGDDTNIYAYVGYRSSAGKILNEWIGKKLTQFPDNYGVFSSASNEAPVIVAQQGRKLLEVMDLKGICEPEFKYDLRDGKYKLTEINLRSMMWHRVGNLSGVHIQYTQYLDALGHQVITEIQDKKNIVHFVFMTHEILNLLARRGYWKYFKHNVFGGTQRDFAVFNKGDFKPFLFSLWPFFKGFCIQCLKILKIK